MMKKIGAILCIVVSVILSYVDASYSFVHMLKCLLLAFGIMFISREILHPYIKGKSQILFYFGVMILCLYTIIAIDTYLLHSLPFLPGMIRYALFSTYGLWYLVFIIVGACIACKKQSAC